MKFEKFTGLIAAPFAPMDGTGRLNTSIIPLYYNFLERNHVSGAFINGTTGEGVSLTQKERQLNAEKWGECLKNGGKVRIINMVGGTSYEECIENAIHSKEAGMSAIALLAPYYFKPDEESLAEFIARVGESVPDMPVYLYHIPALTGVRIKMIALLNRISRMLPNFAGIKFTHDDLMDFMSCLHFENRKYDILWGMDECLLAGLTMGAQGAVGSTYNYSAPLYHNLIRLFNEGKTEQARELQMISITLVGLLKKHGGIGTGKAFMKYVGVDCGRFRLPVKNMTDEMYAVFEKEVKAMNIEQYLSR